jgi:pimeloyl-ACP methyl ester carboxylesterase
LGIAYGLRICVKIARGESVPYATNQGVRIYHEVVGEGPPLILLHGGLSNHKAWYETVYFEALKKEYQLVLIDIRGHGASDKPHDSKAYELKTLVGDFISVLDDLSIEKAHYFGYSLSGRLGFGAAKYASKRFSSFIIGGAHPYLPDQNEQEADLQLFKKGINAVIALMEKASGMEMTPERRASLAANDLDAIVALFSASHWQKSLEDALPNITMPCLFFAGEADSLHCGVKKCADSIPNARFVSLPGTGHFEVLSQSQILLPHITRFLRGNGKF